MFAISKAKLNEYKEVELFYNTVGEDDVLDLSEIVFVAKENDRIVGAVRLVPEHEVLVMRTLNVAVEHQQRGIGTLLVRALITDLEGRLCYCLPYPHLKKFYEQLGFREVDSEALPTFLFERYSEYNKSFAVITMAIN
ncbi:MAG: GNAT family N-acetyltransferase [Candidatus Adlerbacteria bacterium]|nr:GNAT family N-acetyltransferase [Candidatus Adlerbacteria bacterium]